MLSDMETRASTCIPAQAATSNGLQKLASGYSAKPWDDIGGDECEHTCWMERPQFAPMCEELSIMQHLPRTVCALVCACVVYTFCILVRK